jgi:hypothetical protein
LPIDWAWQRIHPVSLEARKRLTSLARVRVVGGYGESNGAPRFVGRSRNTPEGMRRVRVAKSKVMQDFAGGAH